MNGTRLAISTEVLIPKLIPFAKEYTIKQLNIIVLKDGALAHCH
jgi:hypothetical protein